MWRISCTSWPNSASSKASKEEEGLSHPLCLWSAHPGFLSHILSGFSGLGVCSFPGGKW